MGRYKNSAKVQVHLGRIVAEDPVGFSGILVGSRFVVKHFHHFCKLFSRLEWLLKTACIEQASGKVGIQGGLRLCVQLRVRKCCGEKLFGLRELAPALVITHHQPQCVGIVRLDRQNFLRDFNAFILFTEQEVQATDAFQNGHILWVDHGTLFKKLQSFCPLSTAFMSPGSHKQFSHLELAFVTYCCRMSRDKDGGQIIQHETGRS